MADQGSRRVTAGLKQTASVSIVVLMFSASFLLLAGVYDALPAELPVVRIPFISVVMAAPKSVFMVFRVPLMNLTFGLMAAVMLSRVNDFEDKERRASYSALFSTLLLAVALKSDFEALEIRGLAVQWSSLTNWFTTGTVLSVVGGLVLAFVFGRGARIPWTELRLTARDKITLTGLFVFYLVMVAASVMISHRA